MSERNKVNVIYVCRKTDKDYPRRFSRFIDSYLPHPAGYEHSLIIIRKGFAENDPDWERHAVRLAHVLKNPCNRGSSKSRTWI
jgi:hypothetical protein